MPSPIDEPRLQDILQHAVKPSSAEIRDIADKARECKGLTLEESARLLQVEAPQDLEVMFDAAKHVKRTIYGDRIVLFAPIYISNECANNCVYCGFRRDNKTMDRITLTTEQLREEIKIVEDMGHKRVIILYGEHPKNSVQRMVEDVQTIYSVRSGNGEIRRVNVNAAPLSYEEFCELKPSGIGTFQVFQETYHRETYKRMHPSGRKADYDWRVTVWDRCFPSGIDDMGLGPLYGLYDYKFETLAVLQHAEYLDHTYGVGPHTISVPRLEPAEGAPVSCQPPYPLTDDDFRKLVAVIRMAVPYTGMILSTRESPQMRHECLELGISQISAASSVAPGGYKQRLEQDGDAPQFTVCDCRSADEVILDVAKLGYIPSFCTACYRSERTGQEFMAYAKPGEIHNYCLPNALLTFEEYLLDYASEETRKVGEKLIEDNIAAMNGSGLAKTLRERIAAIKAGQRDLYF
jgi:2-iminoacetate synthase